MLSQAIWWSSNILEMFLLVRGVRGRLVAHYPVFYAYMLFVVLQSPVRLVAYDWWYYRFYHRVFWTTEFIGLGMGCFLVFEIYRAALSGYPGTAKMVRRVLFLLFVLALAKGATAISIDPGLLTQSNSLQVEKALRTVQAISIVALITVFASYSIPFGRNLRGIFLGYALFIGVRVICLRYVSEAEQDFWFYLYSASYLGALGMWLVHLWSYQPATEAECIPLQQEYQLIAAKTQKRLHETLEYVRKTLR